MKDTYTIFNKNVIVGYLIRVMHKMTNKHRLFSMYIFMLDYC